MLVSVAEKIGMVRIITPTPADIILMKKKIVNGLSPAPVIKTRTDVKPTSIKMRISEYIQIYFISRMIKIAERNKR